MPQDHEKLVRVLAERMALSPSFQAFFNSHDVPEVWERLVRTFDETMMENTLLILNEEDSMRKDLGVTTARKNTVNETKLRQRIEQMRVAAHQEKA